MDVRPFRCPHHTITPQGLAGGGAVPRPGEISLAHKGVLFLDELPEFKKDTLEILRQPIEDKVARLVRLNGNFEYPSDFMLVAAMNPCKCGYYPDMNKCNCNTRDIYRYLNKISMPFIDRMDVCVEAPRIAFDELTGSKEGVSSAQMREEVICAHQIQSERYKGSPYRFNADVKGADTEEYFRVGKAERKLLEDAFERLNLTARSYHKILKVARTAADLACRKDIETSHIMQAICYRNVDRKFWAV